jgi:hypothetical protein
MALDRSRFLVEWCPPASTDRLLTTVGDSLARSADRPDGIPDVTLLLTIVVPADEVAFGLFTGPSAASVEHACAVAGYPVTRVTRALTLPNPFPCTELS